MNLHNLTPGTGALIYKLNATDSLRRRLLDIGFTPGAQVTCLFQSPAGDPKAYAIMGSVMALRSEEASRIEIICNDAKEESTWK